MTSLYPYDYGGGLSSSGLYSGSFEDLSTPYPVDGAASSSLGNDYSYSSTYDTYQPAPQQSSNSRFQTTNQAEFVAKEPERSPRASSSTSSEPYKAKGTFYGETTNKAEFVPKQPERRAQMDKPASDYNYQDYGYDNSGYDSYVNEQYDSGTGSGAVGNMADPEAYKQNYGKVPFYGETTNRAEFTEKYAERPERTQSFKPTEEPTSQKVPFYGETTNRAEFGDFQFVREDGSNMAAPQQGSGYYEAGGYASQSTTQEDYGPKQGERQQAYRPQQTDSRNAGAFQGETTAHADYPAHEVERRQSQRPQSDDRRSPGAFDGQTSNQADYTAKQAQRQPIARPSEQRGDPGQFSSTTTQQEHYPPKAVERTRNHKPQDGQTVQGGAFDDTTVSRQDYGPKQAQRQGNYKPQDTVNSSVGAFSGETTTQAHYPPKQAERRRAQRPHSSVPASHQPFDDNTTNRQEYYAKQGERVQRAKPMSARRNVGALETETTHQTTYLPHKSRHACPAERLLRNGSVRGLEKAGVDDKGHTFFKSSKGGSAGAASSTGLGGQQPRSQSADGRKKEGRTMTPVENKAPNGFVPRW